MVTGCPRSCVATLLRRVAHAGPGRPPRSGRPMLGDPWRNCDDRRGRLRSDRAPARATRSVGLRLGAVAARRTAVSHDRDDRRGTGPRPADPRAASRRAGRRRLADALRRAASADGPDRRHRLRHVRAPRRWASARSCDDALRAAGLGGAAVVSEQAFELSLDPPARGLVIGVSHEGGTGATNAALRAARAAGAAHRRPDRQRPLAGRRGRGARGGDRRARPELVPHDRLRLPAAGRGRRRRRPLRRGPGRRHGRAGCWRRALATRPAPSGSPPTLDRARTCS